MLGLTPTLQNAAPPNQLSSLYLSVCISLPRHSLWKLWRLTTARPSTCAPALLRARPVHQLRLKSEYARHPSLSYCATPAALSRGSTVWALDTGSDWEDGWTATGKALGVGAAVRCRTERSGDSQRQGRSRGVDSRRSASGVRVDPCRPCREPQDPVRVLDLDLCIERTVCDV